MVPRSVLVVDDSAVVRRVMRQLFEKLTDWEFGGEAGDGLEAIQRATEIKPDLILLDFSMPHIRYRSSICSQENDAGCPYHRLYHVRWSSRAKSKFSSGR